MNDPHTHKGNDGEVFRDAFLKYGTPIKKQGRTPGPAQPQPRPAERRSVPAPTASRSQPIDGGNKRRSLLMP